MNSEILGYTPQQRRMIAAIARYLGKIAARGGGMAPLKWVEPADRDNARRKRFCYCDLPVP